MNGSIQVQNVSKIYETSTDRIEAVSNVSFTAGKGEFIAILGPSGCGKSTLLMMCAGLESITSGTITLDGRSDHQAAPACRHHVPGFDAPPWKTVMENILFPARIQGRSMVEHRQRALELIEMVGLSGFADKKPTQLSGGMRQRVAICRALVTDPDILLMDEPFSALDAMTRDEMNDALLDIWDKIPKTGLFVTHSIREAVYLSDRVLVMTRRPATIIEDLRVPFARSRDPHIGETKEFNELCSHLRGLIEHRDSPRRRMGKAA